jgi:hypothetical protein
VFEYCNKNIIHIDFRGQKVAYAGDSITTDELIRARTDKKLIKKINDERMLANTKFLPNTENEENEKL